MRARLGRLVVDGGGTFLVGLAIVAVLGDDTTHVRQAIGSAALLVGFLATFGAGDWSTGTNSSRGSARPGGGLQG